MMRLNAAVMAVVLIVGTIGAVSVAGAAASTGQDADAYAGTHVSFETTNDAIVNYAVDGVGLVDGIEVESRSEAEQRGAIDAGIGITTSVDVQGSALSTETESETRATIRAESGADIEAHDSERGNLLVRADGESQLVGVTLASNVEAEQKSDTHVVVTNEDGTQGSFVVVGDGEVTVNDEGDVAASVADRSALVYRQYDGERDDDDREQERLIAEGAAAAEVYVTGAADDGEQAVADVVQYGSDTTVEVTSYAENEIQLTAERAESEGTVVITSISDAAFDTVSDIEVTVDGEAATQVDSYSELEAATGNGDNSAYMIQETSSEASVDVLVAVNHFSERTIAMSANGDSADENGADENDAGENGADENGENGDGGVLDEAQPGFGIAAALVALATILLGRTRL